MNTEERREKVLQRLVASRIPVTGTILSKEFNVSRQIIVGDIGIIRAMGTQVYATPRGYVIPDHGEPKKLIAMIACQHDNHGLARELEIIIDNGGKICDVCVEHPLYGEIRVDLLLSTRKDVTNFLNKVQACAANLLLIVTGGVHLHTIEVPDEETLQAIKQDLRSEGILIEEANHMK
jgi:hypothetical protein